MTPSINLQIGTLKSKLYFAERNNQPRVIAKLKKEIAELEAIPKQVEAPKMQQAEETLDHKAAFLFYNSKN